MTLKTGIVQNRGMGKNGAAKGYATLAGLIIIAGFLVASVTSYFVSTRSAKEEVMSNALPLTSDNVYSEIQRDLLSPVFVSSLMATDTFLRDWIMEGEKDRDKIQKFLKEIKLKYNAVTSFLVSERTRTYYHADGVLKTVSESEPRDLWYFRVRRMEPVYEINVDPDMANRDAMTIFINYKVFGYKGEYLGATGVGLTVGSVKELIESYQKRFGRAVYFTDREGRIVLHGSAYTGPLDLASRAVLKAKLPEALQGKNIITELHENGETILVSARLIKELDWILVVEQSVSELLAGFKRTLMINFAICAMVTLFVLYLNQRIAGTYHQKLSAMALEDSLTGVPNRRFFSISFSQAVKEVERAPAPMSVILLDLDHFKEINDKYGHLAGDRLLVEAAAALRSRLRDSDIFCRWGGEEFLALLRGADIEAALGVAEELRVELEQREFPDGERTLRMTMSAGVAEYDPSDTESTLVGRADDALYVAKTTGRNKVTSKGRA